MDLDFLCNRFNALDTSRGALGRKLLYDSPDMAAQRDHAVARGNTDMSGVDSGVEGEFVEDTLLQLKVVGQGHGTYSLSEELDYHRSGGGH
jgi:hypothetical protein